MQVSSVRVENFKSFLNPCVIYLKPGMNVLVGKNNSGKSALLQSLKLIGNTYCFGTDTPRFEDMNTLNLRNLSQRKERIKIVLTLDLDDGERKKALTRLDPERTHLIDDVLRTSVLKKVSFFLKDLWGTNPHGVRATGVCTVGANNEQIPLADLDEGNNAWSIHTYKLVHDGLVSAGSPKTLGGSAFNIFPPDDFPFDLLKTVVSRIYYISPHRVSPAVLPLQTQKSIAPDASNLHQAVHTLANNYPEKFKELERIFCKTFGDTVSLKTPNLPNDTTSIHLVDSSTELEIPLSESGTGLEQFLCFLMIVMISNERRIILIDEPHAFLHPEAEKSLIEIFKANAQHQYVLTTHSTSWMNAADLTSIHWIRKQKAQSTAELISTPDEGNLQIMLEDLGLRNSDLGTADKVIFVEGPSDVEIIPALLCKLDLKRQLRGVLFSPLKETDSFLSKKAEVFIRAYCRLLEQISKIRIPHIFVLDSHGKTRVQIEQLERRFKDGIRFLPRYEIENYLLEPDAILSAIQEEIRIYYPDALKAGVLLELDLSKIQELVAQYRKKAEMYPRGRRATKQWKRDIVGSGLLEKIYGALSLQYSKVKSGQRIARYVDKSTFEDELKPVFEPFLQ